MKKHIVRLAVGSVLAIAFTLSAAHVTLGDVRDDCRRKLEDIAPASIGTPQNTATTAAKWIRISITWMPIATGAASTTPIGITTVLMWEFTSGASRGRESMRGVAGDEARKCASHLPSRGKKTFSKFSRYRVD